MTGSATNINTVENAGSAAAYGSNATRGSAATRKQNVTGRVRALLTCVVAAAIIIALAAFGAALTPAASTVDFAEKNAMPCLSHIFGTDWMGRDMFTRTIAGLALSLQVGCVAAGASSVLALVLGCVAGANARADSVISWLIDMLMGMPHIILLLLISYALGGGFLGVCAGVALTHWPSLARIIRAEVKQCKTSEYVQTSRQLGASWPQIAARHMLPYVLPQFITGIVLAFPHAILHEAALTFLGFGLSPEVPAIGVILSESMQYLAMGCWWLALFPGAALMCVVMLFNLCGSKLRALCDPHTTQL